MEQPFEEKLGALLSNPDLMSKISAMAQSLGAQQEAPAPSQPPPTEPPQISIDPNMLKKLSGMVGAFGVDKEQRALLSALGPYLSRDRIHKLENAMQAAKMAALAASAVQQKSPSSGR